MMPEGQGQGKGQGKGQGRDRRDHSDDIFGFWRRFLEDLDGNGLTLVYDTHTHESRQISITLAGDVEAFRNYMHMVHAGKA
jgi:hypothetical protein